MSTSKIFDENGNLIDQRLECCLLAADGGIAKADPAGVIVEGTYGWSPAYQRTIELRAERDRYAAIIDDISTAVDQFKPAQTGFAWFVNAAIDHAMDPARKPRPALLSNIPMSTPSRDRIGDRDPASARADRLAAELVEANMLAAFYRSCALSGEDPGEADEAREKVRAVMRENADKCQGSLPIEG